ncbi:hypothetical protein GCM10008956_37220 [Deinococcus arenae]|uniref:Uncharacterized protein n=1 Tax=Deinococcus arenae TaxID=1452751 RepID=A0A8H9GVN3_9DEIO|nr:hypothetical protein GCM10008956_37220 [Deinococcus arenae]
MLRNARSNALPDSFSRPLRSIFMVMPLMEDMSPIDPWFMPGMLWAPPIPVTLKTAASIKIRFMGSA